MLLASRSGRVVRDGQGLETQLHSMGAVTAVLACDSAGTRDMIALCSADMLTGVLHAAGAGDKGLLVEVAAQRVLWMYALKATGARYLQCAASTAPLEARVLFSSVGSGLGNVGQTNYAAGNACLDAHALSRRAQAMAACSLQWPWWVVQAWAPLPLRRWATVRSP